MTDEQEAIAQAVLNTPELDRFVDCGESRPLPMFHMATLMQYGEQCANAALAYLRSQGAPVAWRVVAKQGFTRCLTENEPLRHEYDMGETFIPLYLAPVAKVPEWQPIETAPKDGKCLLAIATDDGIEMRVLDRDDKGNWIYDGEPTFCASFYYEPIRWMPLPAAPEYKGE